MNLLELADQIATEGKPLRTAAPILHEIRSRSGLGEASVLSAAEVFDLFAYSGDGPVRAQLEQQFEVVALPRTPLQQALREGDVMVRRGEGRHAHIAIVAQAELRPYEQLAEAGLQPESRRSGHYVQVVEAGAWSHSVADNYARRLTNSVGTLPHDTLVLRPRWTQAEAEAVPGPCPDVVAPHRVLRRGSVDPAVREAQRKLNAFHAREVAAGRPAPFVEPLVPDCMFGPKTFAAVVAFQKRVFPGQPIEHDGVIGPKTWAQLDLVPLVEPPTPPVPKPQPPTLLEFNTDPRFWFLDDAEIAAARGSGEGPRRTLSVFTSQNLVQPLVDGQEYMQALHDDIAATASGDFVHLTAWRLALTQDLIPTAAHPPGSPSRVDNLFRAAATRGVRALVLIWKAVAGGVPLPASGMASHIGENTAARNFFNSIGGRGVLDGRTPLFGSHHQKSAVVLRNGEAVAYCGGIDLAPDRWDNRVHDSDARRTRENFSGWHDVHVRIRGPASLDIELNFRDRWNETHETPSTIPPEPIPPPITDPLPPVATAPGTHHVQVLRTFACAHDHYHDFAPAGELTCRAGYLKAISRAQNYIYIEDQYLVSDEIATALDTALNRANKLIIVVPERTDGFPTAAFNFHQNRFLTTVGARHPGKVHVFHLVQPATGNMIYVHAKVMIIDDVYAAVGSPNINRRGMTHDTELAAAVVDADVVDGVCRYARDLRRNLWGEHLGLPTTDLRIADPIVGVAEWERQALLGTRRVRRHATPLPQSEMKFVWDRGSDPDGRC